ncbi:MAG: UDP-N-acetylmuramoyl-tripeptide--D-alanyl-D-alanine ligase [Patescibacteria group bacterium]
MKSVFKKIIVAIITWEARLLLHNQNPKIIAITGSVGKTSTKDAIFTVISQKFNTRKSQKSFNSEIGVPLTILGLKNAWSNPFKWLWNMKLGFWRIFFSHNYPRVLALEVGADEPGDIKNIVKWVKPDIAVVTKLADIPAHIGKFASAEEVYEEKGRLVEALGPGGIAILNADDERVLKMKKKTMSKTVLFGMSGESNTVADILGSYPTYVYDQHERPLGISFRIDFGGSSIPIEIIGALGEGQAYSVLAAAAVGKTLGMNALEIAEAAKKIIPPNGRMKILEGIKNTVIIDDSYNSSPVAATLALKTLKEIKGNGRKIAALGDMRELGDFAENEHKKIGRLAAQTAQILITVGPISRFIAEGALNHGMPENNIFQFEHSREAGAFMQNQIKEGDIILVKGSQNTIRMEWFVEEIMAHPELKKSLLVRQDKEWANQ